MPAISKPQAQSAFTHITTHYRPSQAPILPPLKQKASGPANDLARSSGPLHPLSLAPYSLRFLIWQPRSDLPFLFLNSASMLPPACQYLTTLSSYITSPALNPTPSIARGCACSSQFNSTNLYRVPSTHSSLSAHAECLLHLTLGTQKWNAWPPESSWGDRHCGMCCSTTGRSDGVNRTRESPKMTVNDIARGPSPIWEDTGRTNTWTCPQGA